MSKPVETDSFLGNFGRTFITAFQTVGAMTLLQLRIFRSLLAIKNFDYDESVTQLFKIGVRSLPVVIATAAFVGL